ncbi:MAG: winged helix-turn-helix transcriptional regulator [Clostridiales bacterium]|nr:winged helix-turn-helix transcriptional regulator [Clostridiales bacterium]
MQDNAKSIAQLLKILANENRLKILCQLIKGEKNVTELSNAIPTISQSALSQHLSIMKAHKILDNQKQGLTVTYYINDERVIKIMQAIRDNYCD